MGGGGLILAAGSLGAVAHGAARLFMMEVFENGCHAIKSECQAITRQCFLVRMGQ